MNDEIFTETEGLYFIYFLKAIFDWTASKDLVKSL